MPICADVSLSRRPAARCAAPRSRRCFHKQTADADARMGVQIPTHDAAPDEGRLRLKLTAVGAVGSGLCAVSAAVALGSTAADHRGFVALARALMVGVPIATGLYAWHRRPRERF